MTFAHEQAVERFWAAELGSTVEFLSTAPAVCCTVQKLYSGVQLVLRNGRLVVASPPHRADFVAAHVRHLPVGQVFSVEFWERLLSPEVL